MLGMKLGMKKMAAVVAALAGSAICVTMLYADDDCRGSGVECVVVIAKRVTCPEGAICSSTRPTFIPSINWAATPL